MIFYKKPDKFDSLDFEVSPMKKKTFCQKNVQRNLKYTEAYQTYILYKF
jgi:hypothetical protein